MSSFCLAYSKLISSAVAADCADNYDHDRFGPAPRNAFDDAKALLKRILGKIGLVSVDRVYGDLRAGLSFIEPHIAQLEWLYAQLSDQESRDLLVSLMAFRALGHRKIKLPTNTPEYWQGIERAKKLSLDGDDLDLGFRGFRAVRMSLRELGYPITLYFVPFAVHIQFVMQPYRCGGSDKPIEATAGDVVLDCGGCYGDTALYFAHKVGPQGKVLSFEFVPSNVELWRRNVEMNPHLMSAIQLVQSPVSEHSSENLFINGSGPGTRVVAQTQDPDALRVETVAIDDVVNREGLPRVDFIKMDIEGSELSALRGAEKTLRKFRPKLAISIYHKLPDFWEIARYLDGLDLNYRFYIRHFTIHAEETVLFAAASE
jgi:FkbM family methyltransferase